MKITLINPSTETFAMEPVVRETVDRLNRVQSAYKQKKFEEDFPEMSHKQVARIDRGLRTKTYWPSYGLLSIAGSLEYEGFEVQYLEQAFCEDKGIWENALEEAAYSDIVGITSLTPSAHNAIAAGRTLKSLNRDVFIVYGGIDASNRSEIYLRNAGDIVVLGEGEQTFLKIARAPRNKRHGILGTAYCSKGVVVSNGPAPPLDLNSLAPPAYHILDETLRKSSGYYIHSSRGCPYNCNFCAESAFWGHHIRFKSVKTILEEIQNLYRNFDVATRIIHFADSTFALRGEAEVHKLVQELKGFPDLMFNCNLRGEMRDLSICKILAKGNFLGYTIGMESASDIMLECMNKKIRHSEHEAFLKAAHEFLPIVESHWIFGFPGETVRTAETTIDTIVSLLRQELITEAWPKIYIPYPGTQPHDNSAKFKMHFLNHDYSKYLRFMFPPFELDSIRSEKIFSLWMECMERITRTVLEVSPELGPYIKDN